MKTFLFIVAALLVSMNVQAQQVSGDGYITEVYVRGDGALLRVKFSEPVVNPGNCGAAEMYVRELDDSPGSDRFLSAVLSAFMAGKRVSFWIRGCSEHEWWGATRPALFDIYIKSPPPDPGDPQSNPTTGIPDAVKCGPAQECKLQHPNGDCWPGECYPLGTSTKKRERK